MTLGDSARSQGTAQGLFRLELRHVPSVVEQLARAFVDDPIWTAVFPKSKERADRIRCVFACGLRYGIIAGEAWAPSERLEGAAVWLSARRVQPRGIAALHARMLAIPFQVGFSRLHGLDALEKTVSGIRKANAPPDYRYLTILGIGPEYQGQGLAAALLWTTLIRCDRENLPVWLETETEANVEFYLRYGFKS